MNYRPIIDDKMGAFKKDFPDYSFTQTVLCALKQLPNFENFKKTDLLSITDYDFYSALENAFRKESDKNKKYQD